ncbi:MAG: VIT domain-containing protein [Planctomycetota bacterium]
MFAMMLRVAAMSAISIFMLPSHSGPQVRSADRLPEMTKQHVEALIDGELAITQVFQALINPSGIDFDLRIPMPLPAGARVIDAQLAIEGQFIQGTLLSREQSQGIYRTELAAGHPAGLISRGPDGLALLISGVAPGSECSMRLVYYQVLEARDGALTYSYPCPADAGEATDPQAGGPQELTFVAVVRSERPILDLLARGFDSEALTRKQGDGRYEVRGSSSEGMKRDIVLEVRFGDRPASLESRLAEPPFPEASRPWIRSAREHIREIEEASSSAPAGEAPPGRPRGSPHLLVTGDSSLLIVSEETLTEHGIERD